MKMHIYQQQAADVKICYFEGEVPCFCLDKKNCICFFKDQKSQIISKNRLTEFSLQELEVKEVDAVVFDDYLHFAQDQRIKNVIERFKENPLYIKTYREGISAAVDGLSRESNPYEENTLEYDFWDVGYFHRTDY
jgi:hypothetical protein